MIDIDALWERHCESFLQQIDNDEELRAIVNMIVLVLGPAYDAVSVFDVIYDWDGELLVSDPVSCTRNYLNAFMESQNVVEARNELR